MEFSDRCYLMLLNITRPRPEHAQIKTIMNSISPDARPVYFDKHGAAFLFTSRLLLGHIASKFAGTLFGKDRFFIVQVGPDWFTSDGNDIAQAWLQQHLRKEGA